MSKRKLNPHQELEQLLDRITDIMQENSIPQVSYEAFYNDHVTVNPTRVVIVASKAEAGNVKSIRR